jgi:hypothetical protein
LFKLQLYVRMDIKNSFICSYFSENKNYFENFESFEKNKSIPIFASLI